MDDLPNNVLYLGNSGRDYFKSAVDENDFFRIENEKTFKIGRYHGVKYSMKIPKNLNIYFIKHPSSFFSWEEWRNIILEDNSRLKEYLTKTFS